MTDEQLARIASKRDIRTLNLEAAQISDAGLKHLARLTELEELNLNNTTVSDNGLQYLAGLKKLRKVSLGRHIFAVGGNPQAARVSGINVDGVLVFVYATSGFFAGLAALLMAGLDGIQNKIHPGDAADKNLYDLPPEEAKEIPQVCGSLTEALEELDKGRAFLTKGGVFSDDFIDAYIALKSEEEIKVRTFVHPLEYELYYSC